MPEMRIHKSGGIVFHPTKEELEIRQLKHSLKQELENAQKLTQELMQIKNELQGGGK